MVIVKRLKLIRFIKHNSVTVSHSQEDPEYVFSFNLKEKIIWNNHALPDE